MTQDDTAKGASHLHRVKSELDRITCNSTRGLTADDMVALQPLLNRQSTLRILDEILNDESQLRAIAGRSYSHTLGFRKIVLLDPGIALPSGTGYGYQLRLHIWDGADSSGVPLVEAMHEHSFDFVSHMLLGGMENQCYEIAALPANDRLAARLVAKGKELPDNEANLLLEALEAHRLSGLGSTQHLTDAACRMLNPARLAELLSMTADEINEVVSMQGRYQSVASGVGAGGYTHRLVEMVKLLPRVVLKLRSGDTYYHPHRFAHRLYIEPGASNATMIVTTPVSQDAKGGSFQRPTHVVTDCVEYNRQLYSTSELQLLLQKFRSQLDQQAESDRPTLVAVD